MKNIIFFDDNDIRKNLLPLTYTRPVALLRVGITTIAQKWISLLDEPNYSFLTATYLKPLYRLTSSTLNLMIAGHMIPTAALARQVAELQQGEAILAKGNLVAFYGRARDFDNQNFKRVVEAVETPLEIASLPDIFRFNEEALALDFEHITKGRESQPLSASNTVIGPRELIFLEPGAEVEGAFLNTTKGPIYIGKDAEVMEGSCIRAPFAACHDSKVRMGAKVYGATTLGPFCKIGGEVENTIMLGYSNKAHEGFLGDAVIGHWCNIGGGTT
ncbi:MAG: glucose-1-phosphate thymidylyltransferase, partial [Muribaculaceae bacterium]|nr:glucose-1-phosphate thymidylyltransferase [Muribaculaceae bacterium]